MLNTLPSLLLCAAALVACALAGLFAKRRFGRRPQPPQPAPRPSEAPAEPAHAPSPQPPAATDTPVSAFRPPAPDGQKDAPQPFAQTEATYEWE
jgi:hypothetical protein